MKEKICISHFVVKEDIRFGERVRRYMIEGKVNGRWKKLCEGSCIGHKRIERVRRYMIEGKVNGRWKKLCEGSCIGHKRIERLSMPVEVTAVRLKIMESLDRPVIKEFSVFQD